MVTPWGTREGALWHVGGDMPDMREGDLGTAACYLTVERLALQAGVESPFWDEASLLMGGCEEPWYKKPLTPRRLRLFLKRYGGSLADDAGRRGHAAFVFSDVMHLHGIPLGGGADGLGALYVRRAESVAMTVAFLATGCTLADMAAITRFNCSIDLKNSVTFDEVMKDLKSYISVSMNDENLDKGSARMKRIINEMHTEGRKTVFDNPLAKSFFKLIPKKMLSEALKSYARSTWLDIASHDLEKLLGTLMYISSKEADVRTVYAPQKNQTRKSRQTDCTVHDVGFRIAPQLAEVRHVYEHEAKGQDGGKTGRHVAPHVRRGHWHGYWTGPRENPTGLEIKWVAPTIVNASRGELEGTVHEVGDRDGRYTLKSTQRECGRAAEQLNGAGRSEEQARDGKSDR